MRALVLVAVLAAACGTTSPSLKGFAEADARVTVPDPQALDVCTLRTGDLVVEVEDAVVREWPKDPLDQVERKKQPLLLVQLDGPGGGTGASEVLPLVAPEGYAAGERLRFFVGRRLLARPLRTLAGRALTVRLAKNNHTAEPLWERYASIAAHYTMGGLAAVGLPSLPSEAFDILFELVRRLDKDDLVLEWSTTVDDLGRALGPRREHRALRFRLDTPRRSGGLPSATLDLVVYLEPEADCP